MADELALTIAFDRTVARFASEGPWLVAPDPDAMPDPIVGVPVPNSFGWREPPKQLQAASRIVWVPGDDASGSAGKILPPRNPGRQPARPLATLAEIATVYIHGRDTSDIHDDRKQYIQARFLFDAWVRVMALTMAGQHAIESCRWVTDKNHLRHGATLRVILTVQAMIPDAQVTLAPADAAALIDPGLVNPAPATSDTAFYVPEDPSP